MIGEAMQDTISAAKARQAEIVARETDDFKRNAQAAWDSQDEVNGVTPSAALEYFLDPTGMLRSGVYGALSVDVALKWGAVHSAERTQARTYSVNGHSVEIGGPRSDLDGYILGAQYLESKKPWWKFW